MYFCFSLYTIILCIGNYAGEIRLPFNIKAAELTNACATAADAEYAGGKIAEAKITVKNPVSGKELEEGKDYKVEWETDLTSVVADTTCHYIWSSIICCIKIFFSCCCIAVYVVYINDLVVFAFFQFQWAWSKLHFRFDLISCVNLISNDFLIKFTVDQLTNNLEGCLRVPS